MKDDRTARKDKCDKMEIMRHKCMHHHAGKALYSMGFIGAAIYYISTATGFWMGVLGVLKALVWPAFLVFGLLKFLHM